MPFLIGDTADEADPSEHTNLRWACFTTIDANPPTGGVIDPLATDTINEQYFYAPGCVVISSTQGDALETHKRPMMWKHTTLDSIANAAAE